MPERHPLAVETPRFPIELRKQLVGPGYRPGYRAIYTITDAEVHVLRVLRSAQDELQPGDANGCSILEV